MNWIGRMGGWLALLTLLGPPAAAHAILVASDPGLDGTVAGPKVHFLLSYNSRIDRKRSRFTLTLPDQTTEALAITDGGSPDKLAADVEGLAPGAYSLRWQVLAVDGHITRGDVPFTVTAD